MTTRFSVGRRFTAWLSAIAVVVTGIPVLGAAGPSAASQTSQLNTNTVYPAAAELARAGEQARRQALGQLADAKPSVRRRAQWTLTTYDIVNAKTSAARHELIKKLPVTIERSATYAGTTTRYVAGGKTRFETFTEAAVTTPAETDAQSGPFVGSGAWECEGEPPCATEQEMEDLATLAVAQEYELLLIEAENEAEWAAHQVYCDQNPWACGPDAQVSGPSVTMAPCWSRYESAVLGIFAGLSATGGVYIAVGAGVKYTAANYLVILGIVGGSGWIAGALVALALACYWGYMSPSGMIASEVAMPVLM